MGKSHTPTYRVEYVDQTGTHYAIWTGRATEARLAAWRRRHNDSVQPGGVNWHLSLALGIVPHISYARIVRQSTREVVAEVTMPSFEVV